MSFQSNKTIVIGLEDNTISQGIQDALKHMAKPDNNLTRTYDLRTNPDEDFMLHHIEKGHVGIVINLSMENLINSNVVREISYVSASIDKFYEKFYKKINLLGFQRHLIPSHILKSLEINGKSNVSLGLVSQDMNTTEQILRKSDMITFNLNSIKSSDIVGYSDGNPAGFSIEQFIQLAKYAGYSDYVKMINFVLPKDLSELSFPFISKLIATCIWYFEESVSQTLLDSEDDLILSIVENESDFIYFFKSSTTGKCYFSYDEKTNKKSCSLQEYEDAIQKGEISERIERGALN